MACSKETCPDCKGKQKLLEWGRRWITCNRCQGRGWIREHG
jgi:DnaJ-class molecular chaperone